MPEASPAGAHLALTLSCERVRFRVSPDALAKQLDKEQDRLRTMRDLNGVGRSECVDSVIRSSYVAARRRAAWPGMLHHYHAL